MQQVTYVEPGKVEVWEVADPQVIDDRDALVRPVAVATCDLDKGIVHGLTPWQGPTPLGHEGIAEVLEVGSAVTSFRRGDLVAIPYQISCGECYRCKAGQTGHCVAAGDPSAEHQVYGWSDTARSWGGFLSDIVRVPFADHMLVALPEGVDTVALGSLSDNIVDGYRTVAAPLRDHPGAPVLVVGGSGSIALYAVASAVGLGSQRVVYVDTSATRLATAEALGAETVAVEGGWPTKLGPFPITVEGNNTAEGLLLALRSTDPGGVSTSTGFYFLGAQLPLFELYLQDITFKTGIIQARALMPEVLEAVTNGTLNPAPVVDDVVPWDAAVDVLPNLRRKTVFTRDRIA